MCAKSLSHVRLFATLWTVAHQASLSMGFSRQEYWTGLLFTSPGDLPNPGVEPVSLTSPALSTGFFTTSSTWESPCKYMYSLILTLMLWTGYHYSHSRDEDLRNRAVTEFPKVTLTLVPELVWLSHLDSQPHATHSHKIVKHRCRCLHSLPSWSSLTSLL